MPLRRRLPRRSRSGSAVALAASLPGSPLTNVAAHDGVSVPSSLAHAIGQELGAAPAVVAGGASQAQTQQQELETPDGVPGDFFGETVSLTADGHTALVGAPFRTVGAAYVFAELGGKWRLEQELQSPAGSATDTDGYSVALSGEPVRACRRLQRWQHRERRRLLLRAPGGPLRSQRPDHRA